MKKLTLGLWTAIGALVLTLLTGQAYAQQISGPVPSNAYIVFDGLDWAWGGPCPYSGGCGDGDLTYQATQGWELPSAADMAIVDGLDGTVYQDRPTSSTFANMFLDNPGGNVPANGTDPVSGAIFQDGGSSTVGSCGASYFNSFRWCDAADGLDGLWAGSQIAANSGEAFFAEQLYVRSAVPEPSTWAMMLIGFAGLGFAGYRASRRTAAFAA